MNSKAHIIAGTTFAMIAIGIAIYFKQPFAYAIWFPIVIATYSLLPDADHQNSIITHLLSDTTVLINISMILLVIFEQMDMYYLLFPGFALVALALIKRTPHRGIMHTVTAAVLLSTPLLFFGPMLAAVAFLSYWSHLWMDIKTTNGLVMYPFRLWGKII